MKKTQEETKRVNAPPGPLKVTFKLQINKVLMHKFNGQKEEKALKQRSDRDQAEAHAYRCDNGNVGIPQEWLKGCLREYLVSNAGNKEKTATKIQVAPRIAVEPMMLDAGISEYAINKTSVPSGGKMGGTRDFCVRPEIKECEVEGILISSLGKSIQELEKDFIGAGRDIGIGSNRINGYGRFEVISFEEIQT